MSETEILVVDDEESLVDLVSSALRFAGYKVRSEQSGYDAYRSVKSDPPHLVVLDVNLPDIDGFDVCRRLRRDGHDMPVIFLTARDTVDDLRAGFSQGGDDYLTKPFSLEELGLRIEALLRRTGAGESASANRLSIGMLTMDLDAHQVFYNDEEIQLSPTEYLLLHYLMLNPGRVVSKSQILDFVWEYDFDGEANIVETYISYLRKKLPKEGAKMIQTRRGVGYMLKAV